jgi:hypothetical protein
MKHVVWEPLQSTRTRKAKHNDQQGRKASPLTRKQLKKHETRRERAVAVGSCLSITDGFALPLWDVQTIEMEAVVSADVDGTTGYNSVLPGVNEFGPKKNISMDTATTKTQQSTGPKKQRRVTKKNKSETQQSFF